MFDTVRVRVEALLLVFLADAMAAFLSPCLGIYNFCRWFLYNKKTPKYRAILKARNGVVIGFAGVFAPQNA